MDSKALDSCTFLSLVTVMLFHDALKKPLQHWMPEAVRGQVHQMRLFLRTVDATLQPDQVERHQPLLDLHGELRDFLSSLF